MNFKQSPMYTVGGIKPIGFIIHGTMGKFDGAVEWLTTDRDENPSSAHFVVGKLPNQATQLVKITDTAWHAGRISNPTARAKSLLPKNILGAYKNPNASFIGIELEYLHIADVPTEAQYKQLIGIMKACMKATGMTNPVIMCHKELTAYKSDFQKLDGTIDDSIVLEIYKRLSLTK